MRPPTRHKRTRQLRHFCHTKAGRAAARKRKRERIEQTQQDWQDHWAAIFDGYDGQKQRLVHTIRQKLNSSNCGPIALPTWTADKKRKPKQLTIDDLSVGMFAVECAGSYGVSYPSISRAFKTATGKPAHRSKCSALLAALQSLGIIVKVGHEVRRKRGAQFAVIPTETTVNIFGAILPVPMPKAIPPKIKIEKRKVEIEVPNPQDDPSPF